MGIISQSDFNGFHYHHSYDEFPDKKSFSLHCHNIFEIYYFIQGKGDFIVEGNRYNLNHNNILLIRPSELHYFNIINQCAYERCALHFSQDFLFQLEDSNLLLSPFLDRELGHKNSLEPLETDGVLEIFQRLDNCSSLAKDECTLKSKYILGELLTTILGVSRRNKIYFAMDTPNALVNNVLEYINTNITIKFTLDNLSEKFFISKYHLSRTFKRYTGISILEYILRKKILVAQNLIENGKKPSEASDICNFGDYSTFYRSYKRIMGCSPNSTNHQRPYI